MRADVLQANVEACDHWSVLKSLRLKRWTVYVRVGAYSGNVVQCFTNSVYLLFVLYVSCQRRVSNLLSYKSLISQSWITLLMS